METTPDTATEESGNPYIVVGSIVLIVVIPMVVAFCICGCWCFFSRRAARQRREAGLEGGVILGPPQAVMAPGVIYPPGQFGGQPVVVITAHPSQQPFNQPPPYMPPQPTAAAPTAPPAPPSNPVV